MPSLRIALPAALVLAAACVLAPRVPDRAATGRSDAERVLAIADRILLDDLADQPGRAASLRLPESRYDTMPDMTAAGRQVIDDQRARSLRELQEVDGKKLEGTVAGVTREAAITALVGRQRARVCKDELWSLSAQNGFQVGVARLGEVQPVGTDELRAQALARWSKIGAYLDQITARLREGLASGYVASAPAANAVVDQLDKLLAPAPKDSPFALPGKRDQTPGFDTALEKIVAEQIFPALRRLREMIAAEIVPKAREAVGVSNIPHGDECYRAKLRAALSLDRDPSELHALGEKQLASIEAEMEALAKKSFGGRPVSELHAWFRDDPQWHYKDREEMLQQARAALGRARAVLPKVFVLLPRSDVTIDPIPEYQEKTTAPHYQAPAQDGSRPAQYRIRLYQAEQQSRIKGEDTAFHETIPGHHLEIGLASENASLPRLLRYEGSGSFSEGWGLYAERLADELNLYSSDADRFGMLDGLAWRAVRLIVDTGLHSLGWSRQQAIDTMLAHSSLSPDFASSEVDRYIGMPGQATSYMVGYLEIRAQRERAQAELGPRFDLRTFHARVLENGSVPLDLLKAQIGRWLLAEKSQGR